MHKKNITIKYIAEKAGMSFSTVAKALHDDPAINQKTREKIKKIAEKYDYHPNILAKGLRSRKTKTIGVILNDLKSPFYSEIFKSIGDILNEIDYTMLLADSNYDEKLEKKNISTMISQGVEGIIISSVSENSENIQSLINSEIKTVFIDNLPANPDINCVYVNHEHAAFLGVEHLVNSGHKDILLLNGPAQLPSAQHFTKGYLKGLKTYNIKINMELIKYNPLTIEGSCLQMDRIFSGKDIISSDDFTAILTLSDVIAIGIYESALRHGFIIPDTYSLIGYDNILATKYLNPPLTTIHQPKKRTGEYSIKLLLEQINNETKDLKKITLTPELIVRKSVRKIN